MNRTPAVLQIPQRQSRWAVAFLAFRTVRSVGLVQLLLLVGFMVARLPSVLILIGVVAALGATLLAIAVLQWWRYTFVIDGGELIVQRGVLQQQRLSVPLARVQSVSLEQKLLHRLVSLVQVSLDTAGTETTEFVIDAVDQSVAQALQRAVSDYRVGAATPTTHDPAVPPPPQPADQVVLQHGAWRIVKVALAQTPFAGLVVIAPLVAVADDLGKYVPFDLPSQEDLAVGPETLLWLVPAILVAGLAVSVVLNLVRVLLADWNLTLSSTPTGLRRDAGLLSTTSVAAPILRVQIIGTKQGFLERCLALHTVNLDTIGSTKLALPGCDAGQVALVRQLVLGDSPGIAVLDQRVSPAEVFRSTRNIAVLAAVVVVGLWFVASWWSMLALLLIPLEWSTTRRQTRLRRWAMNDEAIADRRQFVGWSRQEALLRKINSVAISQTLFERKRALATVTFSTAAGALSVGMIPLEDAKRLRDLSLRAVETDQRVWM